MDPPYVFLPFHLQLFQLIDTLRSILKFDAANQSSDLNIAFVN